MQEGPTIGKDIRRRLVAMVLSIGVKAVMQTHYYQCDGKKYLQGEGGPIGLRLTGTVCRIVMDRWLRKMKIKMIENWGADLCTRQVCR